MFHRLLQFKTWVPISLLSRMDLFFSLKYVSEVASEVLSNDGVYVEVDRIIDVETVPGDAE